MQFRRLVAAALLSTATILLTATPALAHAELIASNPADGASVTSAPTQVQLTFNEPVTPAPNVVEVVGPGNAKWTIGKASVAGAVITAPVQATGPSGAYTLVYRVVSGDGDPVSGNVRFTFTAPATSASASTTTPTTSAATSPPAETSASAEASEDSEAAEAAVTSEDDGGGVPVWVWIVGAVVVVAVGAGIALHAGRGSAGGAGDSAAGDSRGT